MHTSYFMELTLASDRGADDFREGKPLDERMRNRVPYCPAWNDVMWATYRDAYNQAADQYQPYSMEA